MSERRVEESSKRGIGLARGVNESFEKGGDESLDLGVVDDLSELLETGVGGLTDLSAEEKGATKNERGQRSVSPLEERLRLWTY